jgi:PAS domain S-box-containing protein
MSTQMPSMHQAERALLDSEIRLQQVLDNSSAVVFAKDRSGRYMLVNSEFERVTGLAATQMLGKTDEQVFPPALAARFRHNDLLVLQERRSIEFEETADFGAGTRTFISSKFPLMDSNGVAYAVCGMATDITERKHREQAFSAAALAVSQSEEETLYRQLARYLATILDVDCAFIATTAAGEGCPMQMLAFYLDGDVRENFSYPLAGTPCETVVGHEFRLYPSRLAELFPLDDAFRELGLDCYAGHPLAEANGNPLGLIAVVSRRPLQDPALVEATLRIFAVRVNAELERAAAAAALRSSEASYRQIFEASEDAIFVHDWDTGAIVDVNRRACEIYGYTRAELLAPDIREISAGEPPYTEVEALQWIERAKHEGAASFEWRRRNKDGSLHWDEVRLKPAEIGGQRRILAFTREITERKLAEEALRASEEQYRAVFNASADALVLWNSRSERVDVNPAYEQLYGYSRQEVLAGARASELPADHRQQQARIIDRTLAGSRYHGEIETVRRSGERFPIEVRTIPIQHRGEPHVLAMIRDLTERRRVEDHRMQLEAQLRQAQKMEAIGQLTGGIAHDFNNLLTSIMGYVALASDSEPAARDPRLAGYLAQAQRSCERARDLIQQMLMFSRGQRGSPQLASLASVVNGALPTINAGMPGTLELVVDNDESAPPVLVDASQVEQVLLNLCINARDATDGIGRVGIGVRAVNVDGRHCMGCRQAISGRFVEMVVGDDGHGMRPEVIERIFEPFFSTKETGKGSGMGLAMVHGIVHEHGGHVVVESMPGQGAQFRVMWPVASDAGAVVPGEAGRDAAARPLRPRLEGTVLVVDDEVSVGEFMRELLGTWGLKATWTARPEEALELVRADPLRFDVVITDQSMPKLTGVTLARGLHELRADLPVILYTGHGEGLADGDVSAARLCAVMRKPVDPALLSQTLARCLASAPAKRR